MKKLILLIATAGMIGCGEAEKQKPAFTGVTHSEISEGIHYSKIEVVEEFIRSSDVNTQDASGETPLQMAAILGREAATILLLEAGADPNLADNNGNSPLHLLAPQFHSGYGVTDHEEVLKILLEGGGNPNARNVDDYTPLDLYKQYGRDELVKVMSDFLRAEIERPRPAENPSFKR